MNKPNFPVIPSLPANALYRSRLVLPSGGLSYTTLTAADLTFYNRSYTTLTGVQNGSDIDITFAGNLATTNPTQFAYADLNTQLPTDPTGATYKGWMVSIYLSFDTTGFSGSEDQNLGVYCFNALPEARTVAPLQSEGTGYYSGGTISDSGEANRSLKMKQVGTKNSSALLTTTDVVSANADAMTATFLIERNGAGGSGSSASKIETEFATFAYKNNGGWNTTPQTSVTTLQRNNGDDLRIGIWFSRNSAGAFSHTFKITEFSYAILEIVP